MSYAALMVHVDIEPFPEGRVALAVDLAERFHAILVGVTGWASRPTFTAEGIIIDAELISREQREVMARFAEAEARFRAAARPLRDVEWRSALDFPIEVVTSLAGAADLVVVGRDGAAAEWYRSLDPGSTILRAGRPVLVAPPGVQRLAARRVIIAWKDTRECRRAVRDALPFLQAAEEVLLLEVCEPGSEDAAEKRLHDVVRYLERHRVAVGAQAYLHTKGTIAGKLLGFAKDEQADLLVAGGYGHSRLGEWIFGGVTRELLETSEICCLLSH